MVKLKYKTATEIICKTKTIFSSNGISKSFIADNMPFNSLGFINFAKQWNFEVIKSTLPYPKSKGLAEKTVHTCIKLLKKSHERKIDIKLLMLEYRCIPIINVTDVKCKFNSL